MDLPPSGWYPDPYGAPDLLRWWDGSTWTHHTHPGVGGSDGGGGGATGGGGAAAGGVQQTTVQPSAVQAAVAQTSVGQASVGQAAGGGWAARDRVIGDWAGTDWPSGDLLANTKPPKGPRTEPQPALPDTSVQPTTHQPAVQATAFQRPVQPTVYQPAVTSVGAVGATTVQPAAGQPDLVAATTVQPPNGWATPGQYNSGPYNTGGGQGSTAYLGATAGAGAAGGQGGGDGTQVLFLGGDAWQVPGGPSGPSAPNRYGYQQAQQRRRLWLIGGLVAGTAVAIAIIVVVATSLGSSPGASTADQAAATTPAAPTPTAAAATPTPTPTPTASASASVTPPASVLSDGQSGLSYAQLATPWTPVCPSDLNSAFPWTAGESAVAGQINSGQTTWYGEACSGPLPAQYNYSGVRDLENTATNVAQTLENAYYNALNHTITPELSEPVSVSGHAGWEIEYLASYTNAPAQGATWTSEEGAVVVADTGTGNTPVVFFTSVPDTLGQTNVESLVSSLQLTVVPNAASSSPSADAGGSPPVNAGP